MERQFLTADAEHAIAWGEVEVGHRIGRAFAVHGELERFHPCVNRADAHVQRVDDHVFTVHELHMQFVAVASTTRSDVDLDVGAVGRGVGATAERTQIVRVGVYTVAVERHHPVRSRGVIKVDCAVARGELVHGNQQITAAVIRKRSVERDRGPTGVERHGAAIHHVRSGEGFVIRSTRERASCHVLHKNLNLVRLRTRGQIETDGIDGSSSPNFVGSVDLLNA